MSNKINVLDFYEQPEYNNSEALITYLRKNYAAEDYLYPALIFAKSGLNSSDSKMQADSLRLLKSLSKEAHQSPKMLNSYTDISLLALTEAEQPRSDICVFIAEACKNNPHITEETMELLENHFRQNAANFPPEVYNKAFEISRNIAAAIPLSDNNRKLADETARLALFLTQSQMRLSPSPQVVRKGIDVMKKIGSALPKHGNKGSAYYFAAELGAVYNEQPYALNALSDMATNSWHVPYGTLCMAALHLSEFNPEYANEAMKLIDLGLSRNPDMTRKTAIEGNSCIIKIAENNPQKEIVGKALKIMNTAKQFANNNSGLDNSISGIRERVTINTQTSDMRDLLYKIEPEYSENEKFSVTDQKRGIGTEPTDNKKMPTISDVPEISSISALKKPKVY